MDRRSPLLLILALAAALRLYGVDWDGGHGPHPDERRIAFALEEISFRPLNLNPHFFAYGSFPLYLQRAWTGAASTLHLVTDDFHGRIRTARTLSALLGVAMVACLVAMGRRLYGAPTGLLAGLLLALSVLPIQHAHFITVDLYQAAFALFVLERLTAFVGSGKRSTLWTAAALTGLTFATKASSLPLLLPLMLAPFLRPRDAEGRRSLSGGVALAAASATLAVLFFAIGEPYALLDRARFLHDVREQASMVRSPGSVPYTIQYLGTRPYFDDLRQAFTWGMGPALGLAALCGTIAALVRGARVRRSEEIVLLSLFVPYFAITGWFPVKFMRYLLPLYPLWCLWAAQLLVGSDERASRKRRLAIAVVVAATGAYALAFETIYSRPHVWITASRWFYREVPAQATVLLPHWEEGFPLGVDGDNPSRYRTLELALYEPDTERKMSLLAEQLAAGDMLVFPSKRLYGSISNAPDRYPRTSRLFELLFAGELGYRLERVFASRPRLLGWELDDDLSDESFTVYDHPKTLIFRRQETLSSEEVLSRLRSSVPPTPISRVDMLQAETEKPPAPEEQRARGVTGSMLAALLWTLALAGFWLCGSRLLSKWLPRLPALAAGGLAAPLAYLLFVYLCWLGAALGLTSFGAPLCTGVALLLVLLAARRPRMPGSGAGLFVLLVTFAFFAAVRAWNPEVYWGEKPMDFSFLNSIDRATSLPPPEPWMSGKAINYPYLGHFGVAALGKLLHVPPPFSFNLGLAMVGALTAAAAFGAGALLTARLGGGLLAAVLVALAGNLSGPREFQARHHLIDFHYFWATSRVIPNTINEFPLWSFLFADLHAHVMTLPLSLLFVGLVAAWMTDPRLRGTRLLALSSLTLGAIATTSTWSLPVYAGALAGLALLAAMSERRVSRLFFPVAVVAASYLWFLPYWVRFVSPPRNWGWEDQAAPLGDVLLIFGGFLLVVLLALGDWSRRHGQGRIVRLLFVAAVAAAALHATRSAFLVFALACLLAALWESAAAARFAFALAGGAALLGAAADTVWLWDRMNTIFKLYLEMWLFLALASATLLARRRAGAGGGRLTRIVRGAALAAVALVSTFTAVTDVVGTLRTDRLPGPRPTLDGTAYLDVHRPFEALAYRWLNRTIAGSPVLLEAQGPSYQDFSRVSMNTGLPTVLGWEYHLQQRAHGEGEIFERKRAVETLYTSLERPVVQNLLSRYRVAIVFVGGLERRTYETAGLAKFEEWKDLFKPIYQNPQVDIYAVSSNFRWSETAPVVEAPKPAAVERRDETPQAPAPPGALSQPRGLAVDAKGNVWVADFGHSRIQGFDASMQPLRAFGENGEGPGQFKDLCGVAVGPDGLLYVTDTWNHRIQVFDAAGKAVREWGAEFYGPRGIAITKDGSVYVTDTGNGRALKFTSGGKLLARFGSKGSGAGELLEPMGIAVSPGGDVFIADAGNQRVVVFSPDGEVRASWPVPGWKDQAYREPGIAVLPDGRVAVPEPANDRILFFTPKGQPAGERKVGDGSGPLGLAVNRDGSLLVSEVRSGRVTRVEKP